MTKCDNYRWLLNGSLSLAMTASALSAENPENADGASAMRWGHPVTISLSGDPDFLSGGWAKDDSRVPMLSAMREFDLDGRGMKMWEWVGPTEGILVWNKDGNDAMQPDASTIFGFRTWGKSWESGLGALMSLDKDLDGKLAQNELENLWLWVDANSNAKVDAGEMKPLSDHRITQLSLAFESQGKGEEMVENGAIGQDKAFPMLEWWSLGGMSKDVLRRYAADVLADNCIYQWEATPAIEGVEGGLVRYMISEEGTLVGVSMPFKQSNLEEVTGLMVPYAPQEDGSFYSRADMGDTWLDNYVTMGDNDLLYGKTVSIAKKAAGAEQAEKASGQGKNEMSWTAKPVRGPNLSQLLDAATVEILAE